MPSSIEQRIDHLFPKRGKCFREIAYIFSYRHEDALCQKDLIAVFKGKFSDSTINYNFKKLSSHLKELDNHSFIEINIINKGGRPTEMGRLSEAASQRIFQLVTPVKESPPPYIVDNIVIPPIPVKRPKEPSEGVDPAKFDELVKQQWGNNDTIWLSAEDGIALLKQKIGDVEAHRLLQDIASNKGVTGEKPFTKDFYDFKNRHLPGPRPCQHYFTEAGFSEAVSDKNPKSYSMSTTFDDMLAEQHRIDDKRIRAAEELAKKGDRTGIDQLIDFLGDNSERSQIRAINALGKLRETRAVEPLIIMLNSKSQVIRVAALAALGCIGDPKGISPLMKASHDLDKNVRIVAEKALEDLRHRREGSLGNDA